MTLIWNIPRECRLYIFFNQECETEIDHDPLWRHLYGIAHVKVHIFPVLKIYVKLKLEELALNYVWLGFSAFRKSISDLLEQEIRDIIEEADVDSDGLIDYSEFYAIMTANK